MSREEDVIWKNRPCHVKEGIVRLRKNVDYKNKGGGGVAKYKEKAKEGKYKKEQCPSMIKGTAM